MVFLLALVTIGVVFFGYLIMSRLDVFFQKGAFIDTPKSGLEASILIFHDKHTKDLINKLLFMLQQQNMPFLLVSEPYVPAKAKLHTVMAISGNEIDNLLICHEARHLCADVYTIALCRKQLYKPFFLELCIDRVLSEELSAEDLFLQLKQVH